MVFEAFFFFVQNAWFKIKKGFRYNKTLLLSKAGIFSQKKNQAVLNIRVGKKRKKVQSLG